MLILWGIKTALPSAVLGQFEPLVQYTTLPMSFPYIESIDVYKLAKKMDSQTLF